MESEETKEEKTAKGKSFPKPIYLEHKELIKLGELGLSNRQIANLKGCDEKTIRVKYAAVVEKGRGKLQKRIATKMIEEALGGNTVMLIWVSKNILGWSDMVTAPTNQSLTVVKTTVNTNSAGQVEVKSETKEIEPT